MHLFGRALKPASILPKKRMGTATELQPRPKDPSFATEMEGIFSLLEDKCAAALAEEEDGDAGADLLKLGSFIREVTGKKDSFMIQFIERVVKRLKADKARVAPSILTENEAEEEEEEEEEEENADPGTICCRRADTAEKRMQKRQKLDAIDTYNELLGNLHPVLGDLLHEWFTTS
ncbi:hypothetical protein HDU86_001133 [Geranomyces michiganensis]|nr:hypothetical protein HDU86_001133 [Geranomyces michiganensis]